LQDAIQVIGGYVDTVWNDVEWFSFSNISIEYSELVSLWGTDTTNNDPVGLPSIIGTVTEDQVLSADTSGISDADGLGAYSYQWLRDGVDINNATNDTYTLGDSDVGTQISVKVTYTDGNGTSESLTSGLTTTVVNVNDAPVGLPSITGTITEDQVLSADTSGISDADGLGTYSYQWLRDGVTINNATNDTYTLGDSDVGTQISVKVIYTDGNGTSESLTSSLTTTVVNVNDAPVGLPSITGTIAEDQVLSADTSNISDADGLGTFSYQWLRDGVTINNATNDTYTLGDDDVGTQINVEVSYTDGNGTSESLTSDLTTTVVNVNDEPPTIDTDFIIDGAGYAVSDYTHQDQGEATIGDGGASVTLSDNAWKRLEVNKTIDADTVLSFDFKSDVEGEIHGIGFDIDYFISPKWLFQLDGTETWGLQDFTNQYTTGSGYQHYEIRIGDFFTGDFQYLVFAMDDDSGTGA
ncbi:MAG: hypothetical protein GY934_03005, partial [Gammaproteobacteria bacterium]|nr:hypothetical protein [Gammaproteobacteria bacterium]